MIATNEIPAGERLATIPRSCVLTASASCAGAVIRNDSKVSELLEEGLNPWIPLILALLAEQTKVIQIKGLGGVMRATLTLSVPCL